MNSNAETSAGQAGPYTFVLESALAYQAAGRSVLPIAPGSKAPSILDPTTGEIIEISWKAYQEKPATPEQLVKWLRVPHPMGIGIACGLVSGMTLDDGTKAALETLDFDAWELFQTFLELATAQGLDDVLRRLNIREQTPRPGIHLPYLCVECAKNTKLAREKVGTLPDGKDDVKVLIETRGIGGQVVVAPTPKGIHPEHPKRGYELLSGDWLAIPVITPDEREALWNCARALNRYAPDENSQRRQQTSTIDNDLVGHIYNERVSQDELLHLLEAHGWQHTYTRKEAYYLLRPGKSGRGWSATLGQLAPKRFYVFTSSVEHFDNDRSYDPFGVYTRLEHDGDFKAAAKALAELGYGRNGQPKAEAHNSGGDERHTAEHGDDQQQSTRSNPPRTFGGVSETANGYYRIRTIKEQPVHTQISSFIVQPTLRIWVDGTEAVRANIQVGNNTLAEVTIERHCWHSRGAFLKVLPSLDLWCVATDNEIQAIQALVASQKVPSKRGTRTLGLVNGVWVSDEGIFDASGWIQDPELVYLPVSGESPLAGRLRFRVQDPSKRLSVAQAFYNRVWKLNELTVIGALIGWFFATPFKPQIHVQLSHFPILNVWGTMGAGKTSLLRLFWKLFGVDSELLACTDTEFSLLSLLSATSSIPLVFDEFKPYDMKPDQVRRFERILRRVYDGDTEHRGRPDLRLITYRLMAPVAVAGEVSVARQPAMRERIIPVSPSKTWLPDHEEARQAYGELTKLPLHAFASLFIEWSMRQDFVSDWVSADQTLAESINRDMPERIRDGLRVVSFGLRQFERFGQDYALSIPEQLDMGAIFHGILDQLVSADGRSKVGLDILLEHLSAMAEMGRLIEGRHYLAKKTDSYLALRLDSCLAEYRRYAKDTTSDDEVLSKESYLRQLRENHEAKGYVIDVSGRAYFGNDQLRVVKIDRDKAEASGIDLGGFTRKHD